MSRRTSSTIFGLFVLVIYTHQVYFCNGLFFFPPNIRLSLLGAGKNEEKEEFLKIDCLKFATSISTNKVNSSKQYDHIDLTNDNINNEHFFTWEPKVTDAYSAAYHIFQLISKVATSNCIMHLEKSISAAETLEVRNHNYKKGSSYVYSLWLPRIHKQKDITSLQNLLDVITSFYTASSTIRTEGSSSHKNSFMHDINNNNLLDISLGLLTFPNAPATCVTLVWNHDNINTNNCDDDEKSSHTSSIVIEKSIQATTVWVNDTLGKLGLCPFTSSISRAAFGLESVGVKEGPVDIRHSLSYSISHDDKYDKVLRKSFALSSLLLASSFWNAVIDINTIPEEECSTILLLAPPTCYDNNFMEFGIVCDYLLEKSVQAVGADEIIGKAWFHPLYNSSQIVELSQTEIVNTVNIDLGDKLEKKIRNKSIIPAGHALPVSMVEKYINQYVTFQSDDKSVIDNNNINNNSNNNTGEIVNRTKKISYPRRFTTNEIQVLNDRVRHTPHATVNLLRRSQLNASKEFEQSSRSKRPNFVYVRNILKMVDMREKNNTIY